MKKITDKLWSWASILEWDTQEQARKASTMPFVYPRAVIMPDAHLGKGACVGFGYPTLKAIVPATVGVDIGCGMWATRTQFTMDDVLNRCQFAKSLHPLADLREAIEKAVPLSAGNYNEEWWHGGTRHRVADLEAVPGANHAEAIAPNWRLQLGSLGSGNHFIECSADEQERVWLFLHSGSRGVGNKLAQKHIKVAQQVCKGIVVLPHPDLAYLTEGTPEFSEYITDLQWAQHFALLNREEMMDRVITCFSDWIGSEAFTEETVQCHHNYTVPEEIDGQMVWMSRKGAIDAHAGKRGLIPGSMGTASYVVTGKGNADALNTAPHGAGRLYSRSKAKQQFTLEGLEEKMSGIEWRHSTAFLDEDPGAYKDIDQIMEDAADLVGIDHTLRQFVNVKGD